MEQATFEAYVVETCTNHRQAHSWDTNYRARLSIKPDWFVKYGNSQTLDPELQTQSYIFEYAKSHPDAPRIPQVVHYFRRETTTYLVTKFIPLTDTPSDLIERIAQALKWLSTVPPPPGHVLGPLGGPIRHRFFKDFKAPLSFASVDALERYLQKAYKRLAPQGQRQWSPVSIRNDRLMFGQSDKRLSNFGVDEHGKTVLVDFWGVGLLPETFIEYVTSGDRFAPIARSLGLSRSSNCSTMAAVSANLWMTGDTSLGLDEDGNPRTRGGQH